MEALHIMPKTAIHHIHMSCAVPVKFLIKLTYEEYVYLNENTRMFKVSKNGVLEEGYV